MKKPLTVRVVSVLLAVILCALSMSLTAGAVEAGYELIGEVSGGLFTDTGASSGINDYIIEDVTSGKTGKITATVSSVDVPDYVAGEVTETTGDPVYTLVDSIANGEYLFVFLSGSGHYIMTKAMSNNALGTVQATDLTELQNTITGNYSDYLYTVSGSGSTYTVYSGTNYLNISSSGLSLGDSSDLTFTSVSGEDCFTISKSIRVIIWYYDYYLNFNGDTVSASTAASNVYLYKLTSSGGTVYEVSTANISSIIDFAKSLTSSRYTNWSSLGIDGLITAAENALSAVSNPYSVQTDAQTAQDAVNAAAEALHNAVAQLQLDTTQLFAAFRVVSSADYFDYSDYNGGTVSTPVKNGTQVSCTATASEGSRFCYWTKNGAWYSSSAAITVADGEDVYVAWFAKVQEDGSIIVPITWTRTDEQISDTDGDGSYVFTGIDTYSDDNYTDYGVTWDDLKKLTTTRDPFIWDLNHRGTDGNGTSYPYGSYTGYLSTKIGASWTDLDPDTSDNGWKYASARLFRGEFYWPEGYTTSDIIKMVSVNDADYTAIYDYINSYITANPDDTAFASAFQGGTVLPINDDMFIFIHSAADDITTKNSDDALRYLTFFTGSTGKGVWTQVGTNSADWGKTTETKLGTAYSVRAFRWSYPNLAASVADNASITSITDTTADNDIYDNLKHTNGWYTILNTSTLASKLGSVYGVDASFPAGTLFYFDIYVLDNDGAGGMDKWELNFKKADRSVTVNYYYDTISGGNFLGSATITGKVTGDEITLTSGTSAAQLDYYYAVANRHIENDDEIYLSGVQQGTVPYVVTAGENVINVLYTKVSKSALTFVSAGGHYTYDGTEKTASGISLYYGGELVTPTGTNPNTWQVVFNNITYTVTYSGGSSVYAKYVGTVTNTITESYVSITRNGEDASGVFNTAFTSGTLQIVPASVAFIYDYGVENNYTDTANIPSGSVFAQGGVYWKMLTGNGEKTISVTYTPGKIYTAAVSAETRELDINGDKTADMTVTFLPATTVYYEDTAVTPDSGWSTVGTASGTTVYPDGMYGYGMGYADDTGFSDGTYLYTVASGDIAERTKATFTFTGTGFTVHGKTDSESGLLRIYVKNADTDAWVKIITVDTLFLSDAYNGVPLATVSGLDYGTYTVELKAYTAKEIYTRDPAATGRGNIYIDGITVYEAIKKDGSGAETTAIANLARDAYNRDGELNCELYDMRDVYLSGKITPEIESGSSYFINGVWVPNVFASTTVGSATADNGIAAFLIDKGASGDGGYTVAEIVEFGPKNELYIKPGQSLTLVISGKTFDKLTFALSSPTGESVAYAVNSENNTVASTVHMYYSAFSNTYGTEMRVVITNNSQHILSVSSVKITNVGSPASAVDETSLDEVLIYAAAVNGFVTGNGIHGDVNANGVIDPADYLMIKRSILGTYTLTPVQSVAADANTDTEVNATDYLAVKRIFLGTYTAD
ncbi:MAG: dockerin type I domain-containing protein [Eubacteriales bacterium]